MHRKESLEVQNKYISCMVKNMPVLRATTRMTQANLAEKLGISRQTITAIERKKRPMAWSLYLAIICVFEQYEDTKKLFESLKLFDSQFIKEIKAPKRN